MVMALGWGSEGHGSKPQQKTPPGNLSPKIVTKNPTIQNPARGGKNT